MKTQPLEQALDTHGFDAFGGARCDEEKSRATGRARVPIRSAQHRWDPKQQRPETKNFTGVDSPYEPPERPDIRIDTTTLSPEDAGAALVAQLARRGIVGD